MVSLNRNLEHVFQAIIPVDEYINIGDYHKLVTIIL